MKKLSLLLLCIALTLASCSKDEIVNQAGDMSEEEMPVDETGDETGDEANEITNGFIFNKEKYPTPFVVKTIFNNHYQLAFVSEDFDLPEFTGSIDFAGVLIQSVDGQIIPGTYTFLLDTDPNYDPTKNFFDSESGAGLQFTNGDADLTTGYYENISSGTITIAKENTTYSITYSLVYPEGTFEGNYTGEIKNSEEIVTPPSLLGKWQLVSQFEEGSTDIGECELMNTFEFKENGDIKSIYHYPHIVLGTNGEIISEECTDFEDATEQWSLENNVITFTDGIDTYTVNILELSDTILTLEYREGDLIDTYTYKRLGSDKDLLVGKWNVINIVIDGKALEVDDCELKSTLEIKADGTHEEQSYGGLTGNCEANTPVTAIWSLSGNILTLTIDGKTITNTILELSETTLRFEFEDEDILPDGTVIPFKEVWTYVK